MADNITFKMSVIEYLRSEYPSSYEWYFIDNDLICKFTSYGHCSISKWTSDQLGYLKNVFDVGGFYCCGTQVKIPLWQRELELLLEGS